MKLEGHSTVLYKGTFYLFGGFDPETESYSNEVYAITQASVEEGFVTSSASTSRGATGSSSNGIAGAAPLSSFASFTQMGEHGGKKAPANPASEYMLMNLVKDQSNSAAGAAASSASPVTIRRDDEGGDFISPFRSAKITKDGKGVMRTTASGRSSIVVDAVVRCVALGERIIGSRPSPRAFHAACTRGPFMMIIGGSGDTYDERDEEGSKLAESPPSSSTPFAGLPASSSPVAGASSKTSRTSPVRRSGSQEVEVFALHLEDLVWTRYTVPSPAPMPSLTPTVSMSLQAVPQPRCHAQLVATDDALMYYGGFPAAGSSFAPNEWHVFRFTASGTCESLAPGGPSPALWGHSMIHAHRCLMVFGGVDATSNDEVGSLCVYHCDERRWRWAEFPNGPARRALHAAAYDELGGRMVIVGGMTSLVDDVPDIAVDASDEMGLPSAGGAAPLACQFPDVWAFSLEMGTWECLFDNGKPKHDDGSADVVPLPVASALPRVPGRSGHSAVCANGRLFIFGGLIDDVPVSFGTDGKSMDKGNRHTSPFIGVFDLLTRAWRFRDVTVSNWRPGELMKNGSHATVAAVRPAKPSTSTTAVRLNYHDAADDETQQDVSPVPVPRPSVFDQEYLKRALSGQSADPSPSPLQSSVRRRPSTPPSTVGARKHHLQQPSSSQFSTAAQTQEHAIAATLRALQNESAAIYRKAQSSRSPMGLAASPTGSGSGANDGDGSTLPDPLPPTGRGNSWASMMLPTSVLVPPHPMTSLPQHGSTPDDTVVSATSPVARLFDENGMSPPPLPPPSFRMPPLSSPLESVVAAVHRAQSTTESQLIRDEQDRRGQLLQMQQYATSPTRDAHSWTKLVSQPAAGDPLLLDLQPDESLPAAASSPSMPLTSWTPRGGATTTNTKTSRHRDDHDEYASNNSRRVAPPTTTPDQQQQRLARLYSQPIGNPIDFPQQLGRLSASPLNRSGGVNGRVVNPQPHRHDFSRNPVPNHHTRHSDVPAMLDDDERPPVRFM